MQRRRGLAMRLTAKFNLSILAAFLIGFAIAAVALRSLFINDARNQVLENARIMMSAASAIRQYTADDLVPLLPIEHDGKFVAETVPAFAAQTNFKSVAAAFPGFTYREPTLNPTNLKDRPADWEADIIRYFINNPKVPELIAERDTPAGRTLNLSQPIPVDDQACLTCHSTPTAAPPSLTQTYGTQNGFGWNLHDIIGARVVTVPMAVPLAAARATYLTFLGILIIIFAIIFAILNLLLRYLVITPVKRVTAMADAVSLGDETVESYVRQGKDELASLSVSFNRMRESLKQAMEMIARRRRRGTSGSDPASAGQS
jgi:HAMP domain-containing protein